MRVLFLFSALVVALYARTFKMNTRSTGSLRAKLIASGHYQEYLRQQQIRRMQILRTGSQRFMDYLDDVYVGIVQVGTPSQSLALVLDTGSSNMWVIDKNCTSDACNGHPQSGYKRHKYDTQASKTFKKEARTFSIIYGTGSCSGYLATDTVSFAGLSIRKQEFGVATTIADEFGYWPLDGILGLGWPALAVEGVTPPMQDILSELDKPIFTVWMDRKVKPSEGSSGGLITYGDLDRKNCAPNIKYVKLTSLTYWQFPIEGFSVGHYSRRKTEQVISDTGTSWIGAPKAVVSAVVEQVGAKYDEINQLYTVACSRMRSLPHLEFIINNVKYSIPSVEYVLDLELGNGKCALTFFEVDGSGFMPSWILGDTFIRTYCNVHDIGQKRIGFARAKHSEFD